MEMVSLGVYRDGVFSGIGVCGVGASGSGFFRGGEGSGAEFRGCGAEFRVYLGIGRRVGGIWEMVSESGFGLIGGDRGVRYQRVVFRGRRGGALLTIA